MSPAARASFAAAQRMRHRILRHAADMRPPAQISPPPGLAPADVCIVGVAQGPDGRPALNAYLTNLARRQRDRRPVALAGHQPRRPTGRTDQLAARAGNHLDVVNLHPDRHVRELHRVAQFRLDVLPALDRRPGLQPRRREDVPWLAIRILHQRDITVSIWIVLDRLNPPRHAILVPLEIDHALKPLVPAAADPRRGDPLVVPPARLRQRLQERFRWPPPLVADLREVADTTETAPRRRLLVDPDSHD